MQETWKKIKEKRTNFLADEKRRTSVQFVWLYRIIASVAIGMTVVNVFTKKYVLMLACLIFGILCFGNVPLTRKGEKQEYIARWLFIAEIFCLFTYFIISGNPDGFSVIWITLFPFGLMLMYGIREGTICCGILFLILVFFFWFPYGKPLLQYHYGATFMMRFPMLYIGCVALAYYLETVRDAVERKLEEVNASYMMRYQHDELTGVYNRYGFKEKINELAGKTTDFRAGMMILDIDFFKRINDRYGHFIGDVVLQDMAENIEKTVGTDGIVCRWGGEEFAILVPGNVNIRDKAEEIRKRIAEKKIQVDRYEISITVSIGTSVTFDIRNDFEQCVKRADTALYRAKELGRNRVEYEA